MRHLSTSVEDDLEKVPIFILFAMLILPCLLLYAPSLSYFFAQDDFYFLHNASQYRLGDLAATFKPIGPFYRPLSTSLYFSLMLRLSGLWPAPYHAFSLGLFCLNVLLVYHVGYAVFRSREGGFVAAVFYLTRGVHFETVSWVSGIQDLSMTFFVLASMLLYLGRAQTGKYRLFPAMGMFVPALLSKETAVVLPLFLLAYEIILGGRRPEWRRLCATLPFFVAAGIFVLVRSALVLPMPEAGGYATGVGLFWLSNLVRYFLACSNPFLTAAAAFPRHLFFLLFSFLLIVGLIIFAPLSADRKLIRRGAAAGPAAAEDRTLKRIRPAVFGLVVFLMGALPALQFKNRFEPYYMSLGCIGISIAFASVVTSAPGRRLKAAVLVGVCVISLMTNIRLRMKQLSHVARFSPVAEAAISDLRPALETAPREATLYISGADQYLSSALYSGKGIQTFFPNVRAVVFDNASPGFRPDGTEEVFQYSRGKLTPDR